MLIEPLEGLYKHSAIVVLDFANILPDTLAHYNIQTYFKALNRQNRNPRRPENRQAFNDQMIANKGVRYLVGMYGEDRKAMLSDTPAGKEGRTIHMAIDIFAQNLEPVYAPAAGTIVRSGYEEGFGEYGNYLIFQPQDADYYMFFGHLAHDRAQVGRVTKGQVIAHLGDHKENENGGWSRHLHLQILTVLPAEGKTPNGYSTRKDFDTNQKLFPNPLSYFPEWRIG